MEGTRWSAALAPGTQAAGMAGQPMGPGIIAMPGIATGIALWSTHEGRKRLLSLGHRRGVCLRAVTGGGGGLGLGCQRFRHAGSSKQRSPTASQAAMAMGGMKPIPIPMGMPGMPIGLQFGLLVAAEASNFVGR